VKTKKILGLAIVLVLAGGLFLGLAQVVKAAVLSGGSLSLSDGKPSSTAVTYTADFDNVTTSAIKCIKLVFSNAATGGSLPTGMVTSGAALDAATDFIPTSGSWSIGSTAVEGTLTFTYDTGEAPEQSTDRTVVLTGITNGSAANTTYYLQFNTYNNTDCSSDGVDNGTVAFIYTAGQAVSLTVDPSITFTVNAVGVGQSVNGAPVTVASTSTTIPLGTVTNSANGTTAHDLTVTTNAESGYTIYTKYTGVPTYGGATITDWTGDHASPTVMGTGTEAFGYTTEDTDYVQFQTDKYSKFTTTNAEIAKAIAAVSAETTRVGYEAAISGTTEAGNYTTTVILTCTPMY